MSKRPTCPRWKEKLLKKEVGDACPICKSSDNLVCAHTTKQMAEVGWDINYLLAICENCEKKVTAGGIDRRLLDTLKKQYQSFLRSDDSVKPHKIFSINQLQFFLGSNTILNIPVIFETNNEPILWFAKPRKDSQCFELNARLYDNRGSVISTINDGHWQAHKAHFFDFDIQQLSNNEKQLIIYGKKDNTRITLVIHENAVTLKESLFYLPNGVMVEIDNAGVVKVGNATFTGCNFQGARVVFAL